MECRYCGSKLEKTFADLGMSPLSNDYLDEDQIRYGQHILPLKVCVCEKCKLVQVVNYELPDKIFNKEYKYFSSFSSSWLKHCHEYVEMIIKRLELTAESKIVEIASNDGYLLQYFLKYGMNPIGVEPSADCADAAIAKGIETRKDFFTEHYAKKMVEEEGHADLIIGNNVLAHVPEIGNFVRGLAMLLAENGTITMEFPHLLNLIKYNQFDTIYHEHFSYLSLLAITKIFAEQGLEIIDVEQLTTHGGSLRIYAMHKEIADGNKTDKVERIMQEEREFGLDKTATYEDFNLQIKRIKFNVLEHLIALKKRGKTIVGYGAAAKGNTLLNYCGIGRELIDYVVDANIHKQGLFLPGSCLEIKAPEEIEKTKPDYLLILPWNIKNEVEELCTNIRKWDGKFLILIPDIKEW